MPLPRSVAALATAAVLLGFTSAAAAASPVCSSAAQCSHNGDCEKGRCVCRPQWKGDYCDALNVVPGARALGYQGRVEGARVSSWGGAPFRGDNGTYWMVLSEMSGGAGLVAWCCNSQVVLASSPDPLTQPFTRRRVLFKTFAHEPRCARAPTGEFVCYFSYNPHYNRDYGAPCKGHDGNSDRTCRCNCGGKKPTFMSYAADPDGKWSDPVQVATGGPVPAEGLPDLNVAPYISANGSLLALYRNNIGTNIHLLTAADWRDPATYRRSTEDITIRQDGGGQTGGLPEDPFLWRDAAGVFHTINHAYPNPSGPHAWSADGRAWNVAPGGNGQGRAYERTAAFTDAAAISAGCRERPSLVFAADGVTPLALVNGFSPDPSHVGDRPSGSCRFTGVDYSFTLVQPVNQR